MNLIPAVCATWIAQFRLQDCSNSSRVQTWHLLRDAGPDNLNLDATLPQNVTKKHKQVNNGFRVARNWSGWLPDTPCRLYVPSPGVPMVFRIGQAADATSWCLSERPMDAQGDTTRRQNPAISIYGGPPTRSALSRGRPPWRQRTRVKRFVFSALSDLKHIYANQLVFDRLRH